MAPSAPEAPAGGPTFRVGALLAILLALCHLGFSLWYASATPYRQAGKIFSSRHTPVSDIGAPDERQHANYVQRLLEGKGFPVFDPHDPNLGEDYQSHQPPAYYLLEAGWSKLMGVADVSDANAGLKLRALNGWLGAVTVFAVFCLGTWTFGQTSVGLCAAAIAAFLPMNIALSGAISNDPLLYLLCTIALALCVHSIRNGWTIARALGVGLLVGLALLTKTTAMALLPAVFVAALVSPRRPLAACWGAALGPMILLPIGWWIRNQSLYGDPFAIKAFNEAFVNSPQAKTFIDGLGLPTYFISWVGWWTARSFFGAFGYMDIWLNETGLPTGPAPNLLYRLLLMLTVVLLVGWAMSWSRFKSKTTVGAQATNLVFGVVVLLLFISFNLHYFQAQARYLYPAIGPICVALGSGAVVLSRNRWPLALAALIFIFGGTAIYAGMQLGPEFQKRVAFSTHQNLAACLAGEHALVHPA